jgi:phosphohistidine phosphatase
MKTLFVMRHAKSNWNDANLSDFERPLNERGLQAAPFMGELIHKNRFKIDSIVSSPANRAKQTAALVKEAARIKCEIEYNEKIYEASAQRLLEIVSEFDDRIESVLFVGHNPGFENLVKILTGKTESMPTAALAVIDLNIKSWKETSAEKGALRNCIRPKEVN